MGVSCSTSESSCSLPFGNCRNQACQSSCSKAVQDTGVCIEEIVDKLMKQYLSTHLVPILSRHLPPEIVAAIQAELTVLIEMDIVPRSPAVQSPTPVQSPLTIQRALSPSSVD
jgi:hypothetical protein